LKIIIPGNPVSVNNYLGTTRYGRKYLTKKARAYKKTVEEICPKMEILTEDLTVSIKYYFGDKRVRDIDNFSKTIFDSFSGIVWKDDRQITKLILEKFYDKGNARTEVTII
jgi:Holliday junction resolvase RusA-like endonuclease